MAKTRRKKIYTPPEKFVDYIQGAFRLARLLGFFNYYFDDDTHKFSKSWFLSVYNFCVLTACSAAVVSIIPAYYFIIPRVWTWADTAYIQNRCLWFLNFVQLYFGILLTYSNHASNQSLLVHILNSILKCNRSLTRLTNKDLLPNWSYSLSLRLRIYSAVADIYFLIRRPYEFYLITYEVKYMVIFNKVVLGATFLGWHLIQSVLDTAYENLNEFVKTKNSTLRPKDYLEISKICTQISKVKRASNRYYGMFGMIAYMSLVRSIAYYQESFSSLFTSGIARYGLLKVTLYFFAWMLVSGSSPVLDMVVLGIAAGPLIENSNHFHRNVMVNACRCIVTPEVEKIIGVIMRQVQLEDLRTVIKFGLLVDRNSAFEWILDVFSWTIIFFVYNGGRQAPGVLGMAENNFMIKNFFLYGSCFLFALYFLVRYSVRLLKRTCRRGNKSSVGT